jgi:hypothetical protein
MFYNVYCILRHKNTQYRLLTSGRKYTIRTLPTVRSSCSSKIQRKPHEYELGADKTKRIGRRCNNNKAKHTQAHTQQQQQSNKKKASKQMSQTKVTWVFCAPEV